MSRRLPALLFAALLPLSVAAQDQVPSQPDECPEPSLAPRPPEYPEGAVKANQGGTVVLLVAIDACGQATKVDVEKSSGQKALDDAAAGAAGTWHFNPQRQDGKPVPGKVRVPISFDPATPAQNSPKSLPPEHLKMLRQWKRMQVATVPLNADGSLPGYVPDPLPIVTGSIQATVDMLQRLAKQLPDEDDHVTRYELDGNDGLSYWEVYQDEYVFYPAIIRSRRVSDGSKAFWARAWLCEAGREKCKLLEKMLSEAQDQKPIPPPPRPPAELLKLVD